MGETKISKFVSRTFSKFFRKISQIFFKFFDEVTSLKSKLFLPFILRIPSKAMSKLATKLISKLINESEKIKPIYLDHGRMRA